VIEWLKYLLCNSEVPSSRLGSDTDFNEDFRFFSQSLKANARIVP
jgi:hypothetical protein